MVLFFVVQAGLDILL